MLLIGLLGGLGPSFPTVVLGASLDETFLPRITSDLGPAIVYKIVPTQDGKFLIGGHFTEVNGQPRRHLARLNADGSLDLGFQTPPIGFFVPFSGESEETAVHAIVVQDDGRIVVGGFFNYVDDTERRFLARFFPDGQLDVVFDVRLDGRVLALVKRPASKLLIGGEFTLVNFASRSRLAGLDEDGSLDESFWPVGTSYTVFDLGGDPDHGVRVAGGFSELLGSEVQRSLLVRLHADGTVDANFQLKTEPIQFTLSPVIYETLRQPDGKVLVGGNFLIFGPDRLSIARLEPDGSPDVSFQPQGVNGAVHGLALQDDGKVLIGGRFTLVNGVPRENLARLGPDGSLDPDFPPAALGADGIVEDVVVLGEQILVAGRFGSVAGSPRTCLARFIEPRPGAPILAAVRQDKQILISWPAASGPWVLEWTDRLGQDATWSPSVGPAETIGDRVVVSEPLTGGARFYRLRARSPVQ